MSGAQGPLATTMRSTTRPNNCAATHSRERGLSPLLTELLAAGQDLSIFEGATEEPDPKELARALTFARAWAATVKGHKRIPVDPYPLEHPAGARTALPRP